MSWITALHAITDGQVIAIDGKTLRRSFDAARSKAALHMVSAVAAATHIALGQRVTDAKSNEITALPQLLEMLEIKGCLVTIDARGCQREIAQQLVKGGADYVLAVKDNQPKLHAAIQEFFGAHLEDDCASIAHRRFESHEQGHGRKDDRYYYLAKLPEGFPLKERWPGRKAIGMALARHPAPGRSREPRCALLPCEPLLEWPAVCHGGAWSLGHRKFLTRATGRDLWRAACVVFAKATPTSISAC